MTRENLTAILAERVMGWTVCPDRFITGNRSWMPHWRFQPSEKLDDAFRLLEEAAPQEYNIYRDHAGIINVRVRINGKVGEADGESKPLTITQAVARALAIEVES